MNCSVNYSFSWEATAAQGEKNHPRGFKGFSVEKQLTPGNSSFPRGNNSWEK